jgi:hypothetical protein
MDTLKKESPAKPEIKLKTFEICFDKEPTEFEIFWLKNETYNWKVLSVIKVSPYKCSSTKVAKFWTLTFDVDENDWLFWCGFIAGKRWKMSCIKEEERIKAIDKKVENKLM